MDWLIVLSASLPAAATALGIIMRARYRHMSIVAIVDAWRMDRSLDLPAAIEALHGRRTTPEVHRPSDSPPRTLDSQRVD
jgi:hypothetical protein